MKKIVGITTIRSDYNLIRELYKLLHEDPEIDFRVLASGAHMSKTYGLSVRQIEEDGFNFLAKIETLIDSDSKASRIKTASLLLQNSVDIVAEFNPDLIIYAGDREDVIVGSLLGAYLELPTMHLFAGDHVKDGHVDNPVRHAATKLSTVTVASTEQHKSRLLKMGEAPDRVYMPGSIALDKFLAHKPCSKDELRKAFGIEEGFEDFAFLIFHPIPEERHEAHLIFERILLSLKKQNINTFVSRPNTDPGNRAIIDVCEKYDGDENFYFYKNLEVDLFLSIYKNSRFMIGNSSSGVLEAASIPIPAINVGIRQQGRYAEHNVLWTETDSDSIEASIKKATSTEFLDSIADMKNPYGDGKSSQKLYEIIKSNDFHDRVLKKEDILDFFPD